MDDKKYDVGVMATSDVYMTKTINKGSSHIIPVKNPTKKEIRKVRLIGWIFQAHCNLLDVSGFEDTHTFSDVAEPICYKKPFTPPLGFILGIFLFPSKFLQNFHFLILVFIHRFKVQIEVCQFKQKRFVSDMQNHPIE